MSQQASARAKDDDVLEFPFIQDYAKFALRMNFRAIVPLLKEARLVSDPSERKSICLNGLQLLYSGYEDFAILLHAFRNRITGKHLHLTIGVEDQSRTGSTSPPQIFKHYQSAQQMLDNFGFTSLTYKKLSQCFNITKEELEDRYRDIADSIKRVAEYQGAANDCKNKLKHGKPVLEDVQNKSSPDDILFLRWTEHGGKPVLEKNWVNASLEQLEIATILVAKTYITSLDFIGLFVLHYCPEYADEFLHETVAKCRTECADQVRALRLQSQGLT